MSNYVITANSTCDLPEDIVNEFHLDMIPLYYTFDNETIYGDEIKLTMKDFYGKMREGQMATTMQSNPDTTIRHFKEHLEKGYDILHLAFDSGISGSYNSSVLAANELLEQYPDRKIVVIDTLCATAHEGLLVYKALLNQKSGMSMEENIKWVEKMIPHAIMNFTVEDLKYLYKGGRLSRTSAIIGTMINVKPILHVDEVGKLGSLNTVRGRKKSLTTLVDNMEKNMEGYDNDVVMITHADCEEDALFVADLIKERFGIEKAIINYSCPTIGSHTGPGLIALGYFGEKR